MVANQPQPFIDFDTEESINIILLRRINETRFLYLLPVKTKKGLSLRISINYQYITNDDIGKFN